MLFIDDTKLKIKDQGTGYKVGEVDKVTRDFSYLEKGAIVTEFEGVQSMLTYVRDNMKTAKQNKSSVGRGSFWYFNSYKEAMDVYTTSPEKIRVFDENDSQILGGDSGGKDVRYDVTGDYLDVGRYVEGIPEVFGSMYNGNPRGQRVNIIMSIDWQGSTSTATINARSKRVLRLIDWLEAQGVRTKLMVACSSETNHSELTLKHYDEPLELNDIAVTNHSDFLRRIMFRVIEHSKTFQDGYGSSVKFNEAISKNPKLMSKDNYSNELDIFIGTDRDVFIDKVFDDLEKALVDKLEAGIVEEEPILLMMASRGGF